MKGKCPACKKMIISDDARVLLNYKELGLKNWTCCKYCISIWTAKYQHELDWALIAYSSKEIDRLEIKKTIMLNKDK